MPNDPQKMLTLLASIAAFGLVLSLWFVVVVVWLRRRILRDDKVEQRLKLVDPHASAGSGRVLRLWHEGREATTLVPGLTAPGGIITWMQKVRVDAGMEQPLTHILLTLLVVLVAFAMTGYMLTSATLVAISAPLAVLIVFWIFVTNRIARRTATFERQLIDALDLATRSLRVGHPLVGSFQLIADEIPAPVGLVFAEVCQQQQLGMAMEEALRGAAARSGSDDLKLFVTSVVIQLRSGGNLADMMQRLANVIRERNRLARRVKVLTAQTQFSKRILLALPFLVFVLLNVINPKYMLPLYGTTTGQIIAGAALTGLFLGWITMNWISKLNP